jgi:uncharacterized protein (DUF58 family)
VTATRFLDPAVLARIGNLELLARTVVDGFINGLHHSPYFGLSVDFAEHRPYMPGDDVRRIDWRVYGRTDRFYVKEFEADTNANFVVVLDTSGSMDYGSGQLTKLDYARFLAASLTYFSRQQRDRVGVVTFTDHIVDFVPASAKHLDIVLHTLDRVEAGGTGSLEEPLLKITEALARRSIVLLLSDLYAEPDVVQRAVGLLRARGHDVIVFHVLDPAELTFPFDEAAPFVDLETGERMPVVPETLRDEYRAQMTDHLDALGERMVHSQVDYQLFETSTPLDYALFEYLARRERMSRVR